MREMTIGESSNERTSELSVESQEENPQEPNIQNKERQLNHNPDEPTIDHPYAEQSKPYLEDLPEEGGHPPPGKGTYEQSNQYMLCPAER